MLCARLHLKRKIFIPEIGLFDQHCSLIPLGGNHKLSRGCFEISTEVRNNTSEESNETSEESNDKSEEFLVTSVENDK